MTNIHPTALISSEAEIAPDAVVGAYAIIEGPVKIGMGCKIAPHAQIVGNTVIGDGTTVGRGAIIGEAPQDTSFKPATKSGVRLGCHNVIRELVTIHRGSKDGGLTEIGDGNFLMAGSHLGHDVKLGHKNILANAVLLAGHVHVGNNSFLGGGSVFHQFIRIGDYCVVQGNSAISKDLPHYCAAARLNLITGLNVIGLRRQGFSSEDRRIIKDLFDLIYRSGYNLGQAVAAARQQQWPAHAERFLQFFETPSKKGVGTLRSRRSVDE
jgi:UDP-N-acetylglucosamine acyltransferase